MIGTTEDGVFGKSSLGLDKKLLGVYRSGDSIGRILVDTGGNESWYVILVFHKVTLSGASRGYARFIVLDCWGHNVSNMYLQSHR